MEVLNVLQQLYLFDVWVFSQWWMYAPLLIPIMFYFVFFILKWVVLTLPVWYPVITIIKAFKTKTIVHIKESEDKQ